MRDRRGAAAEASPLRRPRDRRRRREAADEDLVDARGSGAEKPGRGAARTSASRASGSRRRRGSPRRRAALSAKSATRANCSSAGGPPVTWKFTTAIRRRAGRRGRRAAHRERLTTSVLSASIAKVARDEDRVRLPRERRPEEAVVQLGQPAAEPEAAEPGAARDDARLASPLQASRRGSAQSGSSWRQTTAGPVGGDELDHLAEEGATLRRQPCFRGRGSRCGHERHAA